MLRYHRLLKQISNVTGTIMFYVPTGTNGCVLCCIGGGTGRTYVGWSVPDYVDESCSALVSLKSKKVHCFFLDESNVTRRVKLTGVSAKNFNSLLSLIIYWMSITIGYRVIGRNGESGE